MRGVRIWTVVQATVGVVLVLCRLVVLHVLHFRLEHS